MTKLSKDRLFEIVPLEGGGVQANFRRTPGCKNFGAFRFASGEAEMGSARAIRRPLAQGNPQGEPEAKLVGQGRYSAAARSGKPALFSAAASPSIKGGRNWRIRTKASTENVGATSSRRSAAARTASALPRLT